MKKIIICLLSFAIVTAVIVWSNVKESPSPDVPVIPKSVTIQEAINSINQEELTNAVNWLTDPQREGRMSAKKGNDETRDYLVNYYKNLGYETKTQEFSVQNLNNFKEAGTGRTANVLATIPGTVFPGEVIIVGAHFDHIGYGPSMSRTPNRREIHPGADDNASGTAAIMGAAKALIQMKGKNKRRIVFIGFSGEEMGLLGSKFYVNNPAYPGAIFMLNLDMVGRLRGALETGTNSEEMKSAMKRITGYPFKTSLVGASGGSDHAPFHQKGIPVVFLHTGMHNDYHTPEDKASKMNFEGLTLVSKYTAHLAWEVDQLEKRPVLLPDSPETEFRDHAK